MPSSSQLQICPLQLGNDFPLTRRNVFFMKCRVSCTRGPAQPAASLKPSGLQCQLNQMVLHQGTPQRVGLRESLRWNFYETFIFRRHRLTRARTRGRPPERMPARSFPPSVASSLEIVNKTALDLLLRYRRACVGSPAVNPYDTYCAVGTKTHTAVPPMGDQGRPGSGPIRFKTTFTNTIYEAMKRRGWKETNSDSDWDFIWAER